jgi:hypothetical protein
MFGPTDEHFRVYLGTFRKGLQRTDNIIPVIFNKYNMATYTFTIPDPDKCKWFINQVNKCNHSDTIHPGFNARLTKAGRIHIENVHGPELQVIDYLMHCLRGDYHNCKDILHILHAVSTLNIRVDEYAKRDSTPP